MAVGLSEQCPGHENCRVPEAGSELGYKERVWEGGRALQCRPGRWWVGLGVMEVWGAGVRGDGSARCQGQSPEV